MAQYVPAFRECEAATVTVTVDSPPAGGDIEVEGTLKVMLAGLERKDSESAKVKLSAPWWVVSWTTRSTEALDPLWTVTVLFPAMLV